MTLQKLLSDLMKEKNISITNMLKLLNISSYTLSNILDNNEYLQYTAFKIARKLGPEYNQFITTTVCPVCGEKFYTKHKNQRCCNITCTRKLEQIKLKEERKRKKELRKEIKIKDLKNEKPVLSAEINTLICRRPLKQPTIPLEKYNQLAINDNMSYGQKQMKERLQLLQNT